MANKSIMNSNGRSKYRHPPKTSFDAPSEGLRSKKNATTWDSRETGLPPEGKTILIELGALHKVLDGLRPDDPESTSAWHSSESCCREIVLRFQNLLREWASDREKLDRCITTDSTLVKCQKCGVLRCLESPSRLEKIVVDKKFGDKIIAQRQTDTMVKPRVGTKRKLEKNVIVDQSRYRPAEMLACSWERDERKINRFPTAVFSKKDSTEESDYRAQQNCAVNIHDSHEKFSDIAAGGPDKQLTLAETIEFLARGNFDDSTDTKSHNFLEKATFLEASPLFRVPTNTIKPVFDFHGSRDVDFHRSYNFLSNDCPLELRTSDTSNFSSSSVEDLMRQSMKTTEKSALGNLNLRKESNVAMTNLPRASRDDSRLNNPPDLATRIAAAIDKFVERSKASGENSSGTIKQDDGNRSKFIDETSDLKATLGTVKGSGRMADCAQNERESLELSEKASEIGWTRNNQSSVVPINVSHFSTDAYSTIMRMGSMSALTLGSSSRSLNHRIEKSERFQREILYDEISDRRVIGGESRGSIVTTSEILPIYRKILESSETMDWESFKRLVTTLHPSQRELWCDICNAVSNEAKRVADETGATTEICIEINPRDCTGNTGEILLHGDEITFELDMTLEDVPAITETRDRPMLLQTSTQVEQKK